jgi:hypothetical protein
MIIPSIGGGDEIPRKSCLSLIASMYDRQKDGERAREKSHK